MLSKVSCTCSHIEDISFVLGVSCTAYRTNLPRRDLSPQIPLASIDCRGLFHVVGDGNCLFPALSRFVYSHEQFHSNIRFSLVQFMRNNAHLFKTFVTDVSFDAYLSNMSRMDRSRTSWGGTAKILAFATLLNCPVYVFCSYAGVDQWTIFRPLKSRGQSVLPYVTLKFSSEHYDAILPLSSNCPCHVPPPQLRHQILARPQLQAAPPPVIDLDEWPSLSPSQSSALPSQNPHLPNPKQTSFPPKAMPQTKKFKQNPVSPPSSAVPSVPHSQTMPRPRENSLPTKAVPTTSDFKLNSHPSKPQQTSFPPKAMPQTKKFKQNPVSPPSSAVPSVPHSQTMPRPRENSLPTKAVPTTSDFKLNSHPSKPQQTSFPPKAMPQTKKFKQNPVSPPSSAVPLVPYNQELPKPRENSLPTEAVPTTSNFKQNSPSSKPTPTATTSNRYFKSEDPLTSLPSTPLSPPPKPQQQHNRKRSYTSEPPLAHSRKVIKTNPEHIPIDLQCETISFDFKDQEQWPSLYSPCHTSPSSVLLCKVPAHMSVSPQSPPSLCSTIPYDLPDKDQSSQSSAIPDSPASTLPYSNSQPSPVSSPASTVPYSQSEPVISPNLQSKVNTILRDHSYLKREDKNVTHDHSYISAEQLIHNTKMNSDVSSKFQQAIMVAPSIACFSCHKLFYPSPTIKQVSLAANPEFVPFLQISSPETINDFVNFCSPCYNSLKSFKVPSQGQKNYLNLTDIPQQLSSLNSIERRLISQVHPYMKVILLPFGQSVMNGQVINFPYEVEEMLHQTKFMNNIIVVQTESNKSIPKEYVADLSKVKNAIAWLKKHNSLYSHYDVKHFDSQPVVFTLDSSKDDPDFNEETIDFTESSLTVDKPGLPKVDFNKEVTGSSSKGADKYVLSLN